MIQLHNPVVIEIIEMKPKNYRFSPQVSEVAVLGYETFHNLDQRGRGMCLHIKGELRPS